MSMMVSPFRSGGVAYTTGEVFLDTAGTGTWTVPDGFNPGNNTIDLIGAGGKGNPAGGSFSGEGGGGGQHARYTNLALTPGSTINYRVGSGSGGRGTSASPGTADTWLSSSTTAYAQAGQTSGTTGGGVGGNAGAVNGATVHNGGTGGSSNNFDTSGGGGGGAGGPSGAGGNGQNNNGRGGNGSAGGTADGGAVAGATAISTGSHAGNTENLWSNGKGPGSGGSGAGGTSKNGGAGGGYGGGGGGGSWSAGLGANGGNGVIRISWAP